MKRFCLLSPLCLTSLCLATAVAEDPHALDIEVADASGQPLPCRIHLENASGVPQFAADLPRWDDHFVCDGSARVLLPPGEYRYEVERGPEYECLRGSVLVEEAVENELRVTLARIADLASENWWSGELHVHRPLEDIELLMRAEDLHVAPVITWWYGLEITNQWKDKPVPENPLVRFDDNRYYHTMGGEDERGPGATLFFNGTQPITGVKTSKECPSSLTLIEWGRKDPNVRIDAEKPFWWDLPMWLALAPPDTIGIANNHMCRESVYPDEAFGRNRDSKRLPPPLGNGFWSQEIYYHVLNCGFRIPPSAGSASGVLPNPLGYNRVYVYVEGPLTYEKWWEGLLAGRSFVTNGPLLRPKVSGALPGHTFTARAGATVTLELGLDITTRDPIRAVEVVKDGVVERSLDFERVKQAGGLGTITFTESGWFLLRVLCDNDKTFRFASTAPYYVEIGEQKTRVSRSSVQFFLNWQRERLEMLESGNDPRDAGLQQYVQSNPAAEKLVRAYLEKDPIAYEEVLAIHRKAERYWEGRVSDVTGD